MQSAATTTKGSNSEVSASITVNKSAVQSSTSTTPLPQRMVISALAGMGAATFCHPLDVVRVQMQTEGVQYKNTLDAVAQIYRRNGLSQGLYAGISAAYLRQWMYGSFRIGVYSNLLEKAQLKNMAQGRDKHDVPFVRKLLMGCTSGAIGSFVGTPSEIALVRMSNDAKLPLDQRRNYSNAIDCIGRIAKEEGALNLWRGAAPTVARATLLSACLLGITSEIKMKLSRSGYFGKDGSAFHGLPVMFVSTLCSSFCANVVANPFDVVKSRMQNMPIAADGSAAYSSMVDCFLKSIRSEGIFVLWYGFTPGFVKLAPYTVICLTLADKVTRAMTGKDAL